MKNLKKYVLGITLFCLVGCQPKPEVLFENIYIGDNLETCLAKGAVQYSSNHDKLELTNIIADTYFTDSEVTFNEKSIVKEMKLKLHQTKNSKTAKEVFNYLTQYFCQRYQGMKTEPISEKQTDDNSNINYSQHGVKNIWETNNIKIVMKSYNNIVDDRIYRADPNSTVDFYWVWASAVEEIEGNWAELIITAK